LEVLTLLHILLEYIRFFERLDYKEKSDPGGTLAAEFSGISVVKINPGVINIQLVGQTLN